MTIDASSLDEGVTIDADGRSPALVVVGPPNELRGLTITNAKGNRGGGIYTTGSLTIRDSLISGNAAEVDGAGIFNNGTLAIATSEISKNVSGFRAGAIYNDWRGELTIAHTAFLGNFAGRDGGAICGWSDSAAFVDCVFVGNTTLNQGGAVYTWNPDLLTFTNCTLTGNSALLGGAVCTEGVIARVVLNNTVVAANDLPTRGDLYGSFSIHHSLVSDGTYVDDGEDGNIGGTIESPLDPMFVRNPSDGGDGWGDDPDTPDIDESLNDDYGDLRLRLDSPAIDAGNNDLLPADEFDLDGDGDVTEPIPFDLAGNARVENGTVDMGAYEYSVPVAVPGDLNDDGAVNSADLDVVRANWGRSVVAGSLLDGDPSGDGVVSSADLDVVRANWGTHGAGGGGCRVGRRE